MTANNPFHGWWKITTAGSNIGFGNYNYSGPLLSDQYIFIDTTTRPYVTITTTYGTLKYPRQNETGIDSPPTTGENQFYFQSPTELLQINDLNGPAPSVFAFGAPYSAWTLKLLDDSTLSATENSQSYYVGYSDYMLLYKKNSTTTSYHAC